MSRVQIWDGRHPQDVRPSIPFAHSLQIFWRVVYALILRELVKALWKDQTAFIWKFLNITFQLALYTFLFGYLLERIIEGAEPVPFLVFGLAILRVWRGTFESGASSLSENSALLNFRNVNPFTLILSRFLADLVVYIIILCIFIFIIMYIGYSFPVKDPLDLALIIVSAAFMFFGMTMTFCVIKKNLPEVAKIILYVLRPMLFVSCILYPLAIIPQHYHFLFLWNPLVYLIEFGRMHMFEHYYSPLPSPWLVITGFTVTHLFLGLFLVRKFRESLIKI